MTCDSFTRPGLIAAFPLTPALSPGERENRIPSLALTGLVLRSTLQVVATESKCRSTTTGRSNFLPLPKGEGRGEGEERSRRRVVTQ